MKLNVKNLSYILVALNSLILLGEVPLSILFITWVAAVLSLLIKPASIRTTFKIVILFGSLFFLKYHFKTYLVPEAGVSFVLILASLKLWELEKESDHFNMFLILALLESCLFLLKPSFLIFFLGMFKIVIFFYFILKIRNYDLSLLNAKRLLILITPSILFSLMLFYTFPRFTSGFINTTNPQLLFSGVDSQLNFKKLGPLNLSSKVVFRVIGLNAKSYPIPLLYWRENILWDYYKEEWKTGYLNLRSDQVDVPPPVSGYRVQLEKDYNEFLPVLDGVSNISKSSLEFNFFSEGSFRLRNITKSTVNYEVNSNYRENWKTTSPIMMRKGQRLKSEKRDQIEELVLNGKALNSDEEKFNAAIEFFKDRDYEYTLNPPVYNSLEDFILYGKGGYCSHFAAAFAYIARVAGLPARIVSGYQGGEYNPFDSSILIRELDAHSWVEVYFSDKGWVRFDPTATIAPGRIQMGANAFNEKLDPYLNLYYYKLPKSLLKFKIVDQTSLWLDSLNTSFSYNILNFDKERQQQLLNNFLPKQFSLGLVFALCLALSLPVLWFLFFLASRTKHNQNEIRYKRFIKKMKRFGFNKEKDETASVFARRCSSALPEHLEYIQKETDTYINAFYRS